MFKNIVVPIDVDHEDRGAQMLEEAVRLKDDDGRVTLVNVVADVPGLISAELPEDLVQKAAHGAKEKLSKMADAAGLSADVQVRSGRPHQAIVDLADEVGADLILIGSHQPGVKDYLLGSTAASVVRHARCPVLVDR